MTSSFLRPLPALCLALAAGTLSSTACAFDWTDNAVSYRTGNAFREPFNPHDIRKNIVSFTHASGYQYGSNYLNVDLLQSDADDPRRLGHKGGAREAYLVYRHTLDIGKLRSTQLRWGPVRGAGLTLGLDWNMKHDVAYNSSKRMLVAGPTLMWDVPGFLNTSVLLLRESNAPSGAFAPISTVRGRYTYDTHPMLNVAWGIPVSPMWSFEGYAYFIASKGRDEVRNETGAETNIDMQLMYDVGAAMGYKKGKLRAGLEYQYWNNKFGNTARTTNGLGYRAKTPMVRVQYHF